MAADGAHGAAGGRDGVAVARGAQARHGRPGARVNLAVASSGTKLFAVGGWDSGSNVLDTLEIYESTTDSWSTAAPMPTARSDLAAAIVDNTLFALGGQDWSGTLDVVEAFDIEGGSWSAAAAPMFRCEMETGDGIGGTEAYVGDANSARECVQMVRQMRPDANGVTYSNTGGTVNTDGTNYLATLPIKVDAAVLARGRERYDITCAICHGKAGDGQGVVSALGVGLAAANLHDGNIVTMPDGQLYRTITYGSKEGKGVMKGYKTQLNVADRWAVVAFVRALQYSRLIGRDELKETYGKDPDSIPAAE